MEGSKDAGIGSGRKETNSNRDSHTNPYRNRLFSDYEGCSPTKVLFLKNSTGKKNNNSKALNEEIYIHAKYNQTAKIFTKAGYIGSNENA